VSDVRYYSASSLGPFRSQCAYAGADPCGKPQQKNNDNTHIYINQSSSYITIIILLSDNGMVAFVTRYHKGYSSSQKIKVIYRYLPQEVGEIVVYYL
jgi:hypothetical protein